MIDYNVGLLNFNGLESSFFHLSKTDPTSGFSFDSSKYAGHTYPPSPDPSHAGGPPAPDSLSLRLILGSHLARYLRNILEDEKGYTSTVGISTSKLLSKLVGSVNKPRGQTTLVPPYGPTEHSPGNAVSFLDDHEIGSIPGVGCKVSQKLRAHVLGHEPNFKDLYTYKPLKEQITVKDLRTYPGMSPQVLMTVLGGPGTHHGTNVKIWSHTSSD
jgi:DNA polymerase iota